MRKLGIVRAWVGHAAAEHEVIERIKEAASNLGVKVIEIDRHGRLLDDRDTEIAPGDVDFVIHTHFETAKVYDAFSYGALWNPLHFYFQLGYEKHARNQSSHDAFLTVGSRWAEDIVLRESGHLHRENFMRFDLSLARPFYASQVRNDRTLFYSGMNWERHWGSRRTSHDVLKILDQQNQLSVYGPPQAWQGFKNYKGMLPFDGRTVVDTIHACGIQLVLLSEAHRFSDMNSSRLLEGVAAGAVIISGRYHCVQKVLGDAALYVDDDAGPVEMAKQICAHIAWINREPVAVSSMIDSAQDVFSNRFCLDNQLADLFEQHSAQLALHTQRRLNKYETLAVDIIFCETESITLDPEAIRRTYEASRYRNVTLHFLVNGADNALARAFGGSMAKRVRFHDVLPPRKDLRWGTGSVIASIWDDLSGDILMVANGCERLFHDCLSRIVRRFEDDPDKFVTISDYVALQADDRGREQRDYVGVEDVVFHTAAIANLAVRRSAYESVRPVVDYLDGLIWREMLLLAFDGRLSHAGHSGFLIDVDRFERANLGRPEPAIAPADQMAIVQRYLTRTRSPFSDHMIEHRFEALVRTIAPRRDEGRSERLFSILSNKFRQMWRRRKP